MTTVLLLTPPLVDFNSPYPATAYLVGYLRSRSIPASQVDLSVELACRLFSVPFLRRMRDHIDAFDERTVLKPTAQLFVERYPDYEATIEPVMRFLQGHDLTLAHRIASRRFCPEGPRFLRFSTRPQALADAFGALGVQDRARCIATTFLVDIVDVISQTVDDEFALSRYVGATGEGFGSFEGLRARLQGPATLVDREIADLLEPVLLRDRPDLVGITVPFADNLPYALRCARIVKQALPTTKVAIGGGYVNTQLRDLDETALFDLVDYVTVDAGERPLECLVEHLDGRRSRHELHRTFVRAGDRVEFLVQPGEPEAAQEDIGFPTYEGLPLDKYFSFVNAMNLADSIFFNLRAHKLTLAHGCYWKQCTFCDVSLDYIGRYDPAPVELTIERMERLQRETGQSAFHFVDEAAPPAILRRLSEEIVARGMRVSWWTNVRFEKAFTRELAELMARAGCIAVSGGLEVASDRLLSLMKKGVTVEQVAEVSRAFSLAGIVVHAYLMYGFPTETEQETIDSLELVRQMFKAGCLHSAVWHRLSVTRHSPIGLAPEEFGIELGGGDGGGFDDYTVPFEDPTGTDHDRLGGGLERAVNCFREGVGLDADLASWFAHPVPQTTIDPRFIERAVATLASAPDVSAGPGPGWEPVARRPASDDDTGAAVMVEDNVWSRVDNGTTFLMSLDNGGVVALNESASAIWKLLCGGASRRSIVARLVGQYDADAAQLERDVDALVSRLAAGCFVRSRT